MTTLILLTLALLITQILDWYTTRVILRRGGIEYNPIVRWLFTLGGVDTTLAIKAIAVTAAGCWIGTQEILLLAGIVAFYVGIIIHNWRAMP